jgi:hypothetical protein
MTTLNQIKNDNHTSVDDHKNIFFPTLKEKYEKNTNEYIEMYGLQNEINILENDIKINKRKLRNAEFTNEAAKTKWKQVIYDNKKYEDETKFYSIVTTLQSFILILVVLGFLNIINGFFISIGAAILYLIIISVFVVKMDVNSNRNQFNYNQYDIKFEPSGACNVRPKDVTTDDETTHKEEQLNVFVNKENGG